ncbi:MAG: PAAR domain-containing protein [Egibacteraceae bacterium]
MGTPAAVMGDRIVATCAIHLIPGAAGAPVKSPPLSFSSPLRQGLATKVLIGGKPAAVQGSSGLNQPSHAGLHASDPFTVAMTQQGTVALGSATVLIENKPAAKTGSPCTVCGQMPGELIGSAATVLIGG